MTYSEDQLLPLSALQHLLFCERQCALIHVEQLWVDNRLTLEGSHQHTRVDERGPRREMRADVVILRGLALRSLELGLSGRADVVELRLFAASTILQCDSAALPPATRIRRLPGMWAPFPIEYKRGKAKTDFSDEVQLCAQALCLEEMLEVRVDKGALFYGRNRKRHTVRFDGGLRERTRAAAVRFREIVVERETPKAQKAAKCTSCSLLEVCVPEAMSSGRSASRYLDAALHRAGEPCYGEM